MRKWMSCLFACLMFVGLASCADGGRMEIRQSSLSDREQAIVSLVQADAEEVFLYDFKLDDEIGACVLRIYTLEAGKEDWEQMGRMGHLLREEERQGSLAVLLNFIHGLYRFNLATEYTYGGGTGRSSFLRTEPEGYPEGALVLHRPVDRSNPARILEGEELLLLLAVTDCEEAVEEADVLAWFADPALAQEYVFGCAVAVTVTFQEDYDIWATRES